MKENQHIYRKLLWDHDRAKRRLFSQNKSRVEKYDDRQWAKKSKAVIELKKNKNCY